MTDIETMLHLVAYDIPNDKLRTKVHKLMERYGQWTQFSLFECFLSHKQSVKLIGEVQELIQDQQAHVRIYALSRDDVARTITIGGTPPHEAEVFIA